MPWYLVVFDISNTIHSSTPGGKGHASAALVIRGVV